MTTCLIGHTGFVGSNLVSALQPDACFNSTSIGEIRSRSFDLVVCAGVSAVKWKANKEPEADWQGIQSLVQQLETIRAGRFVLISTVDVFPSPVGVDEDGPTAGESDEPYGRHRRRLELFVERTFTNHQIIRLPGLFGPGLKKNVIYDLLNNRLLDQMDPEARFQFYDVRRTWRDVGVAEAAGIRTLNVATEPISVDTIAREVFGVTLPKKEGRHANYDFRTRHARHWGRGDGYLQSAADVLGELRGWVESARRAG